MKTVTWNPDGYTLKGIRQAADTGSWPNSLDETLGDTWRPILALWFQQVIGNDSLADLLRAYKASFAFTTIDDTRNVLLPAPGQGLLYSVAWPDQSKARLEDLAWMRLAAGGPGIYAAGLRAEIQGLVKGHSGAFVTDLTSLVNPPPASTKPGDRLFAFAKKLVS